MNEFNNRKQQNGETKRLKCPSCNSTNLQYVTETETKVETSGYSGSKGFLGYLFLGPFGLLCGNCGKSQKTTVTDEHKHFWVCSDCGCKFPALEDLEQEIQKKKNALKGVGSIFVCCLILVIMGILIDYSLLKIMGIGCLLLLHRYFMHIGKYSGCHQMPERSFFINGMQFPLCARCTGILAGYLVGVLLFVLKIFVPIEVCLCFGLVMLGDWYMQYIDVLPSTNIRRFITGTLCGIGYLQILIKIFYMVAKMV